MAEETNGLGGKQKVLETSQNPQSDGVRNGNGVVNGEGKNPGNKHDLIPGIVDSSDGETYNPEPNSSTTEGDPILDGGNPGDESYSGHGRAGSGNNGRTSNLRDHETKHSEGWINPQTTKDDAIADSLLYYSSLASRATSIKATIAGASAISLGVVLPTGAVNEASSMSPLTHLTTDALLIFLGKDIRSVTNTEFTITGDSPNVRITIPPLPDKISTWLQNHASSLTRNSPLAFPAETSAVSDETADHESKTAPMTEIMAFTASQNPIPIATLYNNIICLLPSQSALIIDGRTLAFPTAKSSLHPTPNFPAPSTDTIPLSKSPSPTPSRTVTDPVPTATISD